MSADVTTLATFADSEHPANGEKQDLFPKWEIDSPLQVHSTLVKGNEIFVNLAEIDSIGTEKNVETLQVDVEHCAYSSAVCIECARESHVELLATGKIHI